MLWPSCHMVLPIGHTCCGDATAYPTKSVTWHVQLCCQQFLYTLGKGTADQHFDCPILPWAGFGTSCPMGLFDAFYKPCNTHAMMGKAAVHGTSGLFLNDAVNSTVK